MIVHIPKSNFSHTFFISGSGIGVKLSNIYIFLFTKFKSYYFCWNCLDYFCTCASSIPLVVVRTSMSSCRRTGVPLLFPIFEIFFSSNYLEQLPGQYWFWPAMRMVFGVVSVIDCMFAVWFEAELSWTYWSAAGIQESFQLTSFTRSWEYKVWQHENTFFV